MATTVSRLTLHPKTSIPGIRDAYGRTMNYLRISLTDRCNFRCLYCMPEVGMKFQPRDELLTDEELIRLVGLFAETGVTKLRLTGGEPTIRPHLVDLVREMKSFPNIRELSMTTNALLLSRNAAALKEAGLDRINVSLDTLDPVRFKFMTRGGRLDMVWAGVEEADRVGLTPIKLNSVVLKGHNDHDVLKMAELTLERDWQVRFLEIMPMEGVGMVYDEHLVTSKETQDALEKHFGPLEELEGNPSDPAKLWRIPGAKGTIGFISPMSEPFCDTCNRVRLTADGQLRLCLLHGDEVNLRDRMRDGESDEALMETIRKGVWHKPWGHDIFERDIDTVRGMSQIGG
ncbi:MAG TPA: GTP 3',8-cyclase MoaA [Thermomicrobiales bacterium]|nr:GTP 3',8-cyclase MoaA [Thermomicrobiales bacterium]